MRADKRLGQHFLRDPEVLAEIAAIADVSSSAGVLEIGPGEGALTAFLVRSDKPVVALDRDPRAIAAIQERFGDRVQAVEGDAVQADYASLLPSPSPEGLKPVVVGNLPYNAGTAIYRKLLTLGDSVSRHVLMFQREVAQRIVAVEGTRAYGLLSVMTAMHAQAWLVLNVPPTAFRPVPKVDSAVILVEPRVEPLILAEERDGFHAFLGDFFRTRRKTLQNSFGHTELLESLGINPKQRPEVVAPEVLVTLYRAISARAG